jgi:hypothetical protein
MSEIWIALLPLVLGSALVPVQIILVILLLKSPQQGLAKGLAFFAGMTVIRLLQGLLFGLVFDFGNPETDNGPIAATLLLVLGLLLLVSAFRIWIKEPDADAPPPAWLARLDHATVVTALAFGAVLPLISPKLWVFLLSALETIDAAQPGLQAGVILFLLYVFFAQILLLLPILVRLFFPRQSVDFLAGVSSWLERNDRPIKIAVSLIFGLLFLYLGISKLLS